MNQKLIEALAGAGESQSSIARQFKIDPSRVNRWCSGREVPTADQLDQLEAILSTPADELGYETYQKTLVRRSA